MENVALENIQISDLERLVESKIAENRKIEYKIDFSGSKDSDKKEFLADISSFANSVGGHMIVGIKHQSGIPTEIVGVEGDPDEIILKYDNLIRDGIMPRVMCSIKSIKLNPNRCVYVFQIRRSYIGPHRIVFSGYDRFYGRNSAGKYSLDVDELRGAFNSNSLVSERIKGFIETRISRIESCDGQVALEEGTKIVLHLLPFEAFIDNVATLNDWNEIQESKTYKLKPLFALEWDDIPTKINFDGVTRYCSESNSPPSFSYVHLYRNGVIECVEIPNRARPNDKTIHKLHENFLIDRIESYLNFYRKIHIETPIALQISFLGCRGFCVESSHRSLMVKNHAIDRDMLVFPLQIIMEENISATKIMRPILDQLWNACNYEFCENFDLEGKWIK